jgi:hypothetical protein
MLEPENLAHGLRDVLEEPFEQIVEDVTCARQPKTPGEQLLGP